MSHQCKALVINCIDFRFHTAIREFLVSMGLKDQYDLVSLAGAAKGLVDNDPVSSEFIFKQIETSKRLHGISEVYLIHHMDCGAYGGQEAFENVKIEREKQVADMETARELIGKKFEDLDVKRFLARIKETGGKYNIDFEAIN